MFDEQENEYEIPTKATSHQILHISNIKSTHAPVGFPHSSVGKESDCNAGDPGSIPGFRRYPGEGNGNPLQYSCLENPMDRGAWQVTVHGTANSQGQLGDYATTEVSFSYVKRFCLLICSIFAALVNCKFLANRKCAIHFACHKRSTYSCNK